MAVWTRAGLRATGVDDPALRRALRRGSVLQVGHDRFTDQLPVAVERLVAAPGTRTALCGASAVRAWGLPIDDDAVTVAVPHGSRRRTCPVEVGVSQRRHWSAVERDGLLVTDLETTLVEVARALPLEDSVPILDAALRAGSDPAILRSALGPRRRGNDRARRAMGLADGRSESPLESRLRLLLVLAGMPPLDVQHVVFERGRRVARVDLWYPGVVVEADGFAFHSDRADYRRDRRNGQAYARLGLLVLRFTWEEVMTEPDRVVASVRATIARVDLRAA